MMKMVEMCSYEQTLLLKSSNIISEDVYLKMLVLKRLAAKSFSTYFNICQNCSISFNQNSEYENYGKIILIKKRLL